LVINQFVLAVKEFDTQHPGGAAKISTEGPAANTNRATKAVIKIKCCGECLAYAGSESAVDINSQRLG
jgi:hypothetical protein